MRGSADFFLSLTDLESVLIDCVFYEIVRSAEAAIVINTVSEQMRCAQKKITGKAG